MLSHRVTVTCIITVAQTGGLAQNSGLRGPCSLESLMVPGTGRHPEPMPGPVCVLAPLSHLLGAPQTYTPHSKIDQTPLGAPVLIPECHGQALVLRGPPGKGMAFAGQCDIFFM